MFFVPLRLLHLLLDLLRRGVLLHRRGRHVFLRSNPFAGGVSDILRPEVNPRLPRIVRLDRGDGEARARQDVLDVFIAVVAFPVSRHRCRVAWELAGNGFAMAVATPRRLRRLGAWGS